MDQSPNNPTFACVRCADRKVKCNKQVPCSACIRHNAQCVFRPPKPPRRKRKGPDDELLDERLRRYEALLQERGIYPDQIVGVAHQEYNHQTNLPDISASTSQLPTPTSIVSGAQETIFKPQLLHRKGGTKLVDNNLWSRVAEELHEGDDTLEEESPDEDSANITSGLDKLDNKFYHIINCRMPSVKLSYPSVETSRLLWRAFVENVNPLSKVVHIPTLEPAIEKAITQTSQVPKGFEALMFAIYSVAIISLTETQCKETLGESRSVLLSHYVEVTKVALSRAKFMSTTSLVVLQALFLHIVSIRDSEDPRAVWSLTGTAIRIAEGMGMRLDGSLLGLSPFETEIRRRIWWQIKMHDFRAAELCGQAKFRDFGQDETTPKPPANVNDSDLYPTMAQPAPDLTRPTEMQWCVFRSDLANFASNQKSRMNKMGKSAFSSEEYAALDDLNMKDGFIKTIEDMIETKHLRFCDPCQPLQLLTLVGARAATNLIRFIAHHPRRWATMSHVAASEQQFVWNVVLQLLEQYDMMQSNPQLQRFSWSVPYFIQWHAIIHVLDTLRAAPQHPEAAKAWRLIEALYRNNSDMLLGTERPIFLAVGNLCLKAFDARAAFSNLDDWQGFRTPDFVVKLRHRREAAKERRKAAVHKGMPNADAPQVQQESTSLDIEMTGSERSPRLSETIAPPVPQRNLAPMHGSTWTADDIFWLKDTTDHQFGAGGSTDQFDIDPDTVLAQGEWLMRPDSDFIDWERWDAWLGNGEPARMTASGGKR
ncbi:MAG: hypothetical protein M1814_002498 [Vezdaea aestivalis]|nr:MAG: hypothetical protein M1814_002498 [Vezdaea aestivalis]